MAVVAVLGATGMLVACGADEPSKADLSDALADSGLSRKVSDCVAGAVLDTLSPDQVAELVERGAGGAPQDDPKRTDDTADKLRAAMAQCRTLQSEGAATSTVPISPLDTTTTAP